MGNGLNINPTAAEVKKPFCIMAHQCGGFKRGACDSKHFNSCGGPFKPNPKSKDEYEKLAQKIFTFTGKCNYCGRDGEKLARVNKSKYICQNCYPLLQTRPG